jgi:hypothetical protein
VRRPAIDGLVRPWRRPRPCPSAVLSVQPPRAAWARRAPGQDGVAGRWMRRSRPERGPPPAGQRRHCRPGWGAGRPTPMPGTGTRPASRRPGRATRPGTPRRPGTAAGPAARRRPGTRAGPTTPRPRGTPSRWATPCGTSRRPSSRRPSGRRPTSTGTGADLSGEPPRHRRRPRPDPSRDASGRALLPGPMMRDPWDAPAPTGVLFPELLETSEEPTMRIVAAAV